MDKLNYEEKRNKLKIGSFGTSCIILKTTIGIGMFTFPYCFSQVSSEN
jgi:amino acid permease